MSKTIVIGDEYDEDLRIKLFGILKKIGAVPCSSDWSLAGSQEFQKEDFRLDGKTLTVESETYIGLSISGEDAQVLKICSKL